MELRTSLLAAVGSLSICPTLGAAEPDPWNRAGLWRLDPASRFEQGCFDPCLCPVHFFDDARGSFALSLVGIGDVFDFYDVVTMNLTTVQLHWSFAGSGEFRFSQVANLESLSVDLAQPGFPPQHFNGESAVPGNPDTMILTITVNNRVCYDTVFSIVAARCRADWDRDGVIAPADIAAFINLWVRSLTQNTLDGDYDGNGQVQPADVAAMVNVWFSTLAGAPCS